MVGLCLLLLGHFVILALPFMVGAWLAGRRNASGACQAACGLISIGVISYMIGIVWYLSPSAGSWCSWAVPIVCVGLLSLAALRDPDALRRTKAMAVPLALTLSYACVVLGFGFLFDGFDAPTVMAENRFRPLPIDNMLPYYVAKHVAEFGSNVPIPPVGDWLSSDRPPLQSAIVLTHILTQQVDRPSLLDYQILSTLLQCLWVPAVWTLLHTLRVRPPTIALCLCAVAGCGLTVLNTFFVWPKLLAAAFALTSAALILRPGRARPQLVYAAASTLAALAYLSHGGVAFILVPLAALAAVKIFRLQRPWRVFGVAALPVLVLIAPWIWYQKAIDPPGDRLLKYMLANIKEVDPRPVLGTILNAYGDAGFAGTLYNKLENFKALFCYSAVCSSSEISRNGGILTLSALTNNLRAIMFYSMLPALGMLMALAVGWFRPSRAHQGDRRAANELLLLCLAGVGFWCLAMFGPESTVNHQGTYTLNLLLVCAITTAAASHSQRMTGVVVLISSVLTLLIYWMPVPGPENSITSDPRLDSTALFLLLAGTLAYVAVAWKCVAGKTVYWPSRHGNPKKPTPARETT